VSNLIFPFITVKIPFDAPKLLWVNLVTDGFPAVAFGLDKAHHSLINKKPEHFRFLLTDQIRKMLIYVGVLTGLLIALLYFLATQWFSFELAVTITFTVLVLSEVIRVYVIRYLFKESWLDNKWMLVAVTFSALIQVILVYSPFGELFGLVPIFGMGLLLTIASLFVMFIANLAATYMIRENII